VIHFIYGASGSGKTHTVFKYIQSDLTSDKKVFLIVPEQETVAIEREAVSRFPTSAQLKLEVLNFSRLCNTVFRKHGGLSYNYISGGLKNLFMKRTLNALADTLDTYRLRALGDSALPSLMLSQINEFKLNGVTPVKLEKTAQSLDDNSPLKSKLLELSFGVGLPGVLSSSCKSKVSTKTFVTESPIS
jgi:ATP-dependent helicase/nuclease subunit B